MDRISAHPLFIIETILCLLPIEEAARTSILSREWRYKWTTIPKLVFKEYRFKRSTEEIEWVQTSGEQVRRRDLMDPGSELFHKTCDLIYALRRCKLFSAINQVLLQRNGPIFDFTLSAYAVDAFFEIDQIICHLSRNHPVKRLKLEFQEPHLSSTFDSLTSLTLYRGSICTESLQRLLSICPALRSLCLLVDEGFELDFLITITELLKCLPITIEHMAIFGRFIELESVPVPQKPPTSLINLKYFRFEELSFDDLSGLTFLAVLMKCSPNLEKIDIEIDEESGKLEKYPVILKEYSDVWLEHLNELEIEDFRNTKPGFELWLVRFILARSPNLKGVYLKTDMSDKKDELAMLDTLSWFRRVSLEAEIRVRNCRNDHDIFIANLFENQS